MGERRKRSKKLKIPSCSRSWKEEGHEQDWTGHYEIETQEEKVIRDYSGLDFEQADNLDIFTFWQVLRDAVIWNASQTEEGQQWLDRCWAENQTEPDRETFRRLFGKNAHRD